MNEAKFTPGPWKVDHYTEDVPKDGGLPCAIYAEDDNLIAGFENTYLHMLKAEHAKQSHANAHLIAAAPDLYEALEDAVAILRDMGAVGSMIQRFDTALAKARGET